jgi:hypothetical protein
MAPYVELPDALRPTLSSMDDDQVYLLDTCFAFYVLIGTNVSPESVNNSDPSLLLLLTETTIT